jgi:hypothetical protein
MPDTEHLAAPSVSVGEKNKHEGSISAQQCPCLLGFFDFSRFRPQNTHPLKSLGFFWQSRMA